MCTNIFTVLCAFNTEGPSPVWVMKTGRRPKAWSRETTPHLCVRQNNWTYCLYLASQEGEVAGGDEAPKRYLTWKPASSEEPDNRGSPDPWYMVTLLKRLNFNSICCCGNSYKCLPFLQKTTLNETICICVHMYIINLPYFPIHLSLRYWRIILRTATPKDQSLQNTYLASNLYTPHHFLFFFFTNYK